MYPGTPRQALQACASISPGHCKAPAFGLSFQHQHQPHLSCVFGTIQNPIHSLNFFFSSPQNLWRHQSSQRNRARRHPSRTVSWSTLLGCGRSQAARTAATMLRTPPTFRTAAAGALEPRQPTSSVTLRAFSTTHLLLARRDRTRSHSHHLASPRYDLYTDYTTVLDSHSQYPQDSSGFLLYPHFSLSYFFFLPQIINSTLVQGSPIPTSSIQQRTVIFRSRN